jgi:hypothetical protein
MSIECQNSSVTPKIEKHIVLMLNIMNQEALKTFCTHLRKEMRGPELAGKNEHSRGIKQVSRGQTTSIKQQRASVINN